MKKSYYPYGDCWQSQGTTPTDKKFTGQRLDSTGLYYYGARYYDPTIGRFISADTFVPDFVNPQSLNRYSYCLNNPLKYIDPTGLYGETLGAPYESGYFGWTPEEGYLISIGGEWYPITNESVDTIICDYKESTADTWGEFIGDAFSPLVPEGHSPEEFPAITWTPQTFKLGAQNYTMYGIPKNGISQLTLMKWDDWTTQDWIRMCDAVAVGGDAASIAYPPTAPFFYLVSIGGSTVGWTLTLNEYRNGRITQNDMMRAHINWSTGFIPSWVGIIPALIQSYFDRP